MKKMIHLASDWTEKQIDILNEHNIYPAKGFTAIQIEYEQYLKIESYFKSWEVTGIQYPEFTKQEIRESLLSEKNGKHTHSYPMPDMDFGFKELTYDLSNYCHNCGIGWKQKDAFRLKNVPPAGKKQVFSLGWIYDELFVEKSIYESVFKPLGIKCREVLKYKKDTPFENTVQLVLEESQEALDLKGWPTETCSVCKRTKYQPMPQGFFPMHKDIIAPIFKSCDYFGSGASANKKIFVTKELREKLIALKIDKDRWYIPCK